MIVTVSYERSDGAVLTRRYSDEGYMLVQNETGILYKEAIDVPTSVYTYSESDVLIDDEVSDEEALRILLGGEADEAIET